MLVTNFILTEYAKSVIIQVGIASGIILLIGFMSLLHEVWKRHAVNKVPVVLAAAGKAALVLGLFYFPDQLYLVAWFSLATLAWGMFYAVGYIRKLAARIENGTILQEDKSLPEPFMTRGAKWALIIAVVALTMMGLEHQSSTLATVTSAADSTQQEYRKDLSDIKHEATTAKNIAAKTGETVAANTAAIQSTAKKVTNLENKAGTKEPVKVAATSTKKAARTVLRSVSYKPIERDTALMTRNQSTIPIQKAKGKPAQQEKTFWERIWPFSMIERNEFDRRETLIHAWDTSGYDFMQSFQGDTLTHNPE